MISDTQIYDIQKLLNNFLVHILLVAHVQRHIKESGHVAVYRGYFFWVYFIKNTCIERNEADTRIKDVQSTVFIEIFVRKIKVSFTSKLRQFITFSVDSMLFSIRSFVNFIIIIFVTAAERSQILLFFIFAPGQGF